MSRRLRVLLPGLAVAGVVVAALAPRVGRSEHHETGLAAVKHAIAVLHPTEGNSAHGTVTFMDHGDGKVHVIADISGLTPGAKHGFHIHQFGDCSSPDGKSAGGHYDPAGVGHHGEPGADQRHAGDLGNIQADTAGHGTIDAVFSGISIASEMHPIIGRGVIVHAAPDDYGQPTGNAGARIACGVIGVANTK
jgi:superoxide dismutase, Cu-Zn family